jgi:hypothetical protein
MLAPNDPIRPAQGIAMERQLSQETAGYANASKREIENKGQIVWFGNFSQ